MIHSDEIKKKAEVKFSAFLQALVYEEDFFPLTIRSAKGSVHDSFEERIREAEDLYEHSKEKTGTGYTVQVKTIKTHTQGLQTRIEKIFFATEEDFTSFINKKKETEIFKNNLAVIKEQFCTLHAEKLQNQWITKHIRKIMQPAEHNYWQAIFRCAVWFLENPDCNKYLREIPLPVHTKFIEQNTALIFSLYSILHTAADSESIHSYTEIYRQWGVRTAEALIRFRMLDGGLPCSILNEQCGIDDMQIPVSSFAKMQFNAVKYVFIVENIMLYLTFPSVPESICIFGAGFAAVQLKQNTALHKKSVYYFGDLDEHGFEILSSVRSLFPHVKSFCMDTHTYHTFSAFAVKGETSHSKTEDLHLTDEELALFTFLRENKQQGRLEQEKISQDFIKTRIKEVLDEQNVPADYVFDTLQEK